MHARTSSVNYVLVGKLYSSQELNRDDIRARKMVAVHLAGKFKEISKVYMALVIETDSEDVQKLYMARAGGFYHWSLLEDQSWQDKAYFIYGAPQPTYRMNTRD